MPILRVQIKSDKFVFLIKNNAKQPFYCRNINLLYKDYKQEETYCFVSWPTDLNFTRQSSDGVASMS